ncbi:MAG: tRNA lysidine(34) synthetase TilS [Chromatiales bacterium]|nr:tRNA lysidine(34) synthetase TilS [Gammaproteobacteria bacterium]
MEFSPARLLEGMPPLPRSGDCHVAFSGGLDSSVLLHALVRIRDRLPGELKAIHIHHGLQSEADAWGNHCRDFAGALEVPYQQINLALNPSPGESVEALAREARYRVLADLLQPDDWLLTAQHQDDQAETLLLQLLRGSGPAGLAAMAKTARLGKGWLQRPLLGFTRQALEAYAQSEDLTWVEDPSNRDLEFSRNYLRHEIMPRIQAHWPAASATLSRSAGLCADAQVLIDELAAEDMQRCRGSESGRLSVKVLSRLSEPRIRSLLRHWVRDQGVVAPGYRHLQRMLDECVLGREDANPLVGWGGMEVRRYRDDLFIGPRLPPHDAGLCLSWNGEAALTLPSGLGRLEVSLAEHGVDAERWQNGRIEVRFRRGGERCRPAGDSHHRSLKQLFQTWGVPPWLRDRIPLIFLDGKLAIIPGFAVCQPFVAAEGAAAVQLDWKGTVIPLSRPDQA